MTDTTSTGSTPADSPVAGTDLQPRLHRWLSLTSAFLGVLTVLFLLIAAGAGAGEFGGGNAGQLILAGVVVVVLSLAPAVVPLRFARPVAFAAAGLTTLLVVLSLTGPGLASEVLGDAIMLLPLAGALWVTAVVPGLAGPADRTAARRRLRISAGAIVSAPGLALLIMSAAGKLETTAAAIVVGLALMALGMLYSLGHRVGYWLVAAVGIAMLIGGMIQPGMLVLLVWTAGGIWLVLGMGALAGTRGHRQRRPSADARG